MKVRPSRQSLTASHSRSTVFGFRFIRLVTSWARHRSGSSIGARSGLSRVITRPNLTVHASRLNRFVAMSLSASAPSGYLFTAGRRPMMYSRKSSNGGRPISVKVVRACCMPTLWVKRNACWLASPRLGLTTQDLPGAIYTHGAVEAMNRAYRETGIVLPPTTHVAEAEPTAELVNVAGRRTSVGTRHAMVASVWAGLRRPLHRAGCASAARDGAGPLIVGSYFPTMSTGLDCSPRSTQRARRLSC